MNRWMMGKMPPS